MRGAHVVDDDRRGDRLADDHRPPRRDDRRARLRHQVERRRRDARPAPQDPPEQGRAADAEPRPARAEPGATARPTASAYDCNGDGVFNVVDYACDSRVDARRDPRRVGPAGVLDPQDLLIAFSDGTDDDSQRLRRRHRRLGLPRQRQRPLRRRPVRPRHRRGAGLERRGRTTAATSGTLPELHGHAAARRRLVRRRRQPLRAGRDLRGRQRRRRSCRRRSARSTTRSSRRQAVDYAYRHGVDRDRLGRRRGRPAPQLALELPAHDRRQLGHAVRHRCTPPDQSYLQFNGCTNFSTQDHARDPEHELLLERDRPRRRAWPGLIYSAALNASDAGRARPSAPDTASASNGDPLRRSRRTRSAS